MDPLLIALFVFLIFWSAFFSGTELALMSIPKHKLNSLFKMRKPWSRQLKKIKENNDRLLISILIWNNLVNVYTAALATTIAISIAEKSWLPQAQMVWIATWIITFVLLLFWEIIPKSLATKNATKIALFVAPIYKVLIFVLFPIIIFIELIIKIFTWWKQKVHRITDEEIESFIDMWRDFGTLEKSEHEQIKNILDFWDILIEEIMIPRVYMDCVSSDITVWKAIDYYLSHTHSRIPVFTRTIDKINNFFTIRDIISEDKQKKLSELNLPKIIKVPLNQPIDKLLKTFQKSSQHIAIVIDEYGWVAWIITLENILEEIIWDIKDEKDNETDEIKEIWIDAYIVESWVLIEDILEKYNIWLENIWLDEKEFGRETLSYVITHILERFPNPSEILNFYIKVDWVIKQNLELKIIDVSDWKIWKVEIKKN
jgi:CBS domain containing-hemolysin-like protein